MSELLYVECAGNANDRGQAYGAQAKEAIHANIRTYEQLFAQRFGLQWDEVRRRIEPVVPTIAEFDTALLDEIRGIATGADADFLDLVVLNARSSITMTASEDDCTTIAFIPPFAGESPIVMGQNWDNMARLEPVVLRIRESGRPDILTLTEAGTLAKIGLNGAGVGVCVNGLRTPGSHDRGVPLFVMLRRVLQATSLSEALAVITTARREAPHNYLVGSSEGAAFSVETTTADFDIIPPTGRFIAHTNHFLSHRLAVRDVGKTKTPHSVVRLWRAQRVLDTYGDAFSVSDMVDVLSDHFDAPNSICRHPIDTFDPFVMQTNCAALLELAAGRMHVSRGQPCAQRFTTFDLAGRAVPA